MYRRKKFFSEANMAVSPRFGRSAAAAVASFVVVAVGGSLVVCSDPSIDDEGIRTKDKSVVSQPSRDYPKWIASAGSRIFVPNCSALHNWITSSASPNLSYCHERAQTSLNALDSYPNFSRYGNHSYLKKYLTPEIYNLLKDKKTKSGVTLEHMIQSGILLPWGAHPPRGCGVYAGDEECYAVFAPLLRPILEDYHGISSIAQPGTAGKSHPSQGTFGGILSPRHPSRLRRQVTNLNPEYVLSQNLDPTGDYILSSRMRVSRSVRGFQYSPVISRRDRRTLEGLFRSCIQDESWKNEEDGTYFSVMDMSNAQHDDWIQRHVLFHDPDEYALAAGLGRDWPDARGIYVDQTESPEVMIWCNAEDHFRIISMAKGGDLLGVFTRLSRTVNRLEASLRNRGHQYCIDPTLGYLNTSPENIGTALRASVFVKLVRLGQQPGFDDLLHRLHLEASTRFKNDDRRYTGIFDIANAERLGQSEVQLINTMIHGVGRLIALEKQLARGEKINLEEIQ